LSATPACPPGTSSSSCVINALAHR
jgi:hypothetical protein